MRSSPSPSRLANIRSAAPVGALLLLSMAAAMPAAAQPGGFTIGLTEVVTGLSSPIGIVHAGDGSGRLFIVQQGGSIRIFDGNELLSTPFLSISVAGGGEQGLLGLAFPDDYESHGFFFVHYSQPGTGDTRISRFRVSADPNVADDQSEVVLLSQSQPFANHNGGQMAFGPDGYLYVGLGDGGSGGDPQDNGQDLGTLLGKLLRLDAPVDPMDPTPSFSVPADNPFVGQAGVRPEIWAWGLRNPWRFSFDRLTGDLFIADVGQNEFEEVSFQPAASSGGENYGWRLMEANSCFNPPTDCNDGSLTLPVMVYDHSLGCSVTGGYRYRGSDFPLLQGVYLFADFCSGRIWGGIPGCGGGWQFQEFLNAPFNITTFGEDEDGELYLTDFSSGRLMRVEVTGLSSAIFTGDFEPGDLSEWSVCVQ